MLQCSYKKVSYFPDCYEKRNLGLIPSCIEVFGKTSTEALCGSHFPFMIPGSCIVQIWLRVHWLYLPQQGCILESCMFRVGPTVTFSINLLYFLKHIMKFDLMSKLWEKLIFFSIFHFLNSLCLANGWIQFYLEFSLQSCHKNGSGITFLLQS